jgi:hypothetical protein
MVGPGMKMHVIDEVSCELLQKNEYSNISESEYSENSEINVKISLYGEKSVSSDEEENSGNSSMQREIWTKSDAE